MSNLLSSCGQKAVYKYFSPTHFDLERQIDLTGYGAVQSVGLYKEKVSCVLVDEGSKIVY